MVLVLFIFLSFNLYAQNAAEEAFVNRINGGEYILENPSGSQDAIFNQLLRETVRNSYGNFGSPTSVTNSQLPRGTFTYVANFFGNLTTDWGIWDNKLNHHRYFTFERQLNALEYVYTCEANIEEVVQGDDRKFSLKFAGCTMRPKSGRTGERASGDVFNPLRNGTPIFGDAMEAAEEGLQRGNRRGSRTQGQ